MSIKTTVFVLMLTFAMLLFSNISYAVLEDIDEHWCKNEIEKMYENGYVRARDEKLFEPDEPLTKAEFCMTVNKLLNYSEIEDLSSEWKEEEFAIGIEKGYMPIGSVDDTLTREEACVIFDRISDITIDNALNSVTYESFLDYNQVSVWAKNSVKRLVINGKIIGYTDNTLKMKNKLTRAEFVMIMTRFDETAKQIDVKDISKNISLSLINNLYTELNFNEINCVLLTENSCLKNSNGFFIIPKKNILLYL